MNAVPDNIRYFNYSERIEYIVPVDGVNRAVWIEIYDDTTVAITEFNRDHDLYDDHVVICVHYFFIMKEALRAMKFWAKKGITETKRFLDRNSKQYFKLQN